MYKAIKKGDRKLAEQLAREHYGHHNEAGWGNALNVELVIDAVYLRDQ